MIGLPINHRKPFGITLVETMIYTVLASIFLLLIFSVLINFFTSRRKYLVIDSLDETAVRTFNVLARDLHRAVDFNLKSDYPDGQTLTLNMVDGTELTYTVENGRLARDYLIYSSEYVTFEELNFKYLESGDATVPALKINLSLSAQRGKSQASSEYETIVSLRRIAFTSREE